MEKKKELTIRIDVLSSRKLLEKQEFVQKHHLILSWFEYAQVESYLVLVTKATKQHKT